MPRQERIYGYILFLCVFLSPQYITLISAESPSILQAAFSDDRYPSTHSSTYIRDCRWNPHEFNWTDGSERSSYRFHVHSMPVLDMRDVCGGRVSENHLARVRSAPTKSISSGYDTATTECLNLFMLQEVYDWRTSHDCSFGLEPCNGKYTSTRFPVPLYMNRNHATTSSSICVTDFVLDTASLSEHVASLRTTDDVYEYVQALLSVLYTLKKSGISHNDIHLTNLLVSNANSKLSILLLDFTWSVSPVIRRPTPPPVHLNGNNRRSDGQICDVFSMGTVIYFTLHLHATVDISWVHPLVDKMLDESLNPSEMDVDNIKELSLFLKSLRPNSSASIVDGFAVPMSTCNCNLKICEVHTADSSKARVLLNFSGYHQYVSFEGVYDRFTVSVDSNKMSLLAVSDNIRANLKYLSPIIRNTANSNLTVADVGGSQSLGFYCFLAVALGMDECIIAGIDDHHAPLVESALDFLGGTYRDKISVFKGDLCSLNEGVADIVIAHDMIFLAYSCSRGVDSLIPAVHFLASRTRKLLLVEWIDSSDPVVQNCEHINTEYIRNDISFSSPYTFHEFYIALLHLFGMPVSGVGNSTSTRYFYSTIKLSDYETKLHTIQKRDDYLKLEKMYMGVE